MAIDSDRCLALFTHRCYKHHTMTILYLIVARGGSKRLPGKNLRQINGISLIGYKCLAAKQSQSCTDVMLSTDSHEIADEARKYNVSSPFIRPDFLATDTATTEGVVRHAITWCAERGKIYDAIALLEPSSPFVRPQDYDQACEIMEDWDAQFVYSEPFGKGICYLFRWHYLDSRVDLYDNPEHIQSFMMPAEYSLDIDMPNDLIHASYLADRAHMDLSWTTS